MQMMVPQAQLMVSEMPDRASASPAASAEHAEQRRNSDENSEQLSGNMRGPWHQEGVTMIV